MSKLLKFLPVVLVVGILAAVFVKRPHEVVKPVPVVLPSGMESMEQWEDRINRDSSALTNGEFNRIQLARRRELSHQKGKKMSALTPTILNSSGVTNPANALDGDAGTYAAFASVGSYILLDLGATAALDSWSAFTVSGDEYDIIKSDAGGSNVETIGHITDIAQGTSFDPDTTARYVKVVCSTHSSGQMNSFGMDGTAARSGHIRIGLASGDVLGANFSDDATVTSGANYSADTQAEGWFQHVQITILNPPATGFVTSVAGDYWEKGSETIGHAVQQNQVLGLNTGLIIVDDVTGDLYRLKVASGVLSVEAA